MNITYEEALANARSYIERKSNERKYSLNLSKGIVPPPAYESAEMLEGDHSFREKMYFVQSLLFDNTVTVYYGEGEEKTEVCSFLVTKDLDLGTIDEFRNTPSALRFLVNAVYSIFLKNSLPL